MQATLYLGHIIVKKGCDKGCIFNLTNFKELWKSYKYNSSVKVSSMWCLLLQQSVKSLYRKYLVFSWKQKYAVTSLGNFCIYMLLPWAPSSISQIPDSFLLLVIPQDISSLLVLQGLHYLLLMLLTQFSIQFTFSKFSWYNSLKKTFGECWLYFVGRFSSAWDNHRGPSDDNFSILSYTSPQSLLWWDKQ